MENPTITRRPGLRFADMPSVRLPAAVMALATTLVCLCGCDGFSTDGLRAIIDDRESYVDFPGRRLAEGAFHNWGWDGSFLEGGFIVAQDEEERLTLIPLTTGEAPCKAGAASDYVTYWSMNLQGDDGPGFMAYRTAPNDLGFGQVHFIDHHCEALLPSIESARLFPLQKSIFPAVLLITEARELLAVRPRVPSVEKLVGNVQAYWVYGELLWTIEAGEIVSRDRNFKVLHRVGNNVQLGSQTIIAGLQSVAYLDDDGLHLTSGHPGKDVLVSNTGCKPAASLPSGSHLTFCADCAEPGDACVQLMARGSDQVDVLVAENAAPTAYITGGASNSERTVAYLTDVSAPGELGWTGTLWTGKLGGPVEVIAESAALSTLSLGSSPYARVMAEWNGKTGTLIQWEPRVEGGAEALAIAQGLPIPHPNFESLVLVNYDGQRGDRARITPEGVVTIRVTGSPSGAYTAKDSQVFLSDVVQPTTGTEEPSASETGATVPLDFERATGTVSYYSEETGVIPVQAGVRSTDYSMAVWKSHAVVYRREVDPARGTGILGVRFPGKCDVFETQGVTESRVVYQPEPGILYVSEASGTPSVWFARAQ